MTDDDFGTVNLKRGDHTRELEVLRQHRASLVKMLAEVDQQLRELELFSAPALEHPPAPQHPARRGIEEFPLDPTPDYEESQTMNRGGGLRVLLIIGAAVLALALIGYLIWRASSDRPASATTAVVDETATTTPATVDETETIAPATPAAGLMVRPQSHEYGLVRKGTRATRQFEVTNNSEEPMPIAISRSTCRCLYYEHAPVVPPKAKESITVTVDGARAKSGTLREAVKVTSKSDPAVSISFDVIATVR